MGEVWEATDETLGRRVAVKVVDLTRTGDRHRDEVHRRALREARAAAQIDHPRTVRMFDVIDDVDRLHLVMELVDATPLDDEVRRDGPLDPRAAARLGLDVLDALMAAHRAGVVHRDVKPSNVLVLEDGSIKLGDFGIATIKEDPDLTATGLVLGTPKFLSPEAARGERATVAADLWGLGALLYFAVEGQGPFDRGDTLPTLHAVINDPPRPMERAGALEPVITALLTKDPASRPSAEDAARMLRAVLDGDLPTVVATPPTQVLVASEPAAPAPVRRDPARAESSAGKRLLVGLAALALIVGIGAVAIAATTRDDEPTATGDTTSTTAPPATAVGGAAEAETTTTAAPTTTEAPVVDLDRPDGVPETWVPHDGDGWRIWHPADWVPNAIGGGATDFTAPDGSYLRVASVSPPSHGGDPVKAWEAQEEAFRAQHPDYERIRLEETDYRDHEAAIWEYTFSGRHADNLGFVIDDTGYALNFVTGTDSWDDTADLREGFRAGFEQA